MARIKKTREEKLAWKREYYRKWRARNREKTVKATAEYRKRNPGAGLERHREWCKENSDRCNALQMKRKAARLQRTPAWADLEAILEFYSEAKRLSNATGIPHHVDHIIPLQGKTVSGLHVENNLQILTATENMSKGNKFVDQVLESDDEIGEFLNG